MEKSRYQKGIDKLMEFTVMENKEVSTHLKITDSFKNIAPDLSRYMIEFTYGDIYTRPELDNKQRALITIASLVTLGTEPQLELHINTGLTAGLTPEEIIETFIHLLSYTGFPRVINAIEVAKKVFEQRGVTVELPEQNDLI
ncbi:carboxymuconolactone decarboxylase family protein [Paenibacillus polymyxa]|uniref:carboxymuconolactone decarboxylase family protein n=1 Tax=Paenibacillus polymyxa TaxID=1406 RepID=UPI0008FC3C30|nr:carboxymuconolactone decarboxylase family protein [Paenibacillus polymyxa]APB70974.1 carboxymuconolactone decarboxylase family protein [Paenibacillus polymyxa]